MSLLTIEEPRSSAPLGSSFASRPVFGLGFRPFYLAGAALAAVNAPLWLLRYFGLASGLAHIDLNWHVHEMVFGFAIAIIIGFLYTAGRNWTGLWTPRGKHLAAIAGVWLLGRVAMLTSPSLAAIVDTAFLPIAAWPLYDVLKRSGNRRNMFLIGLLAALTACNALYHAAVLGWLAVFPLTSLKSAILIIVLIESVIAGRVIPNFTANAIPGIRPVMMPTRDRLVIAVTAAASLSWILNLPTMLTANLALAAAISQLLRLSGWHGFRTTRNPLLWILHVSYGWIPIGFALLGLAMVDVVSESAAFHVLAIGSMGGLIIGMVTRTALGHTGRQLKAGRMETWMYVLLQLGVVSRFAAAMTNDSIRNILLSLAAFAWSTAFVLYLIKYLPYLTAVRIDGKEG